MYRIGFILLVVAALTGTSALAQTSAPAPAAASSFAGVIVGNNVNVRSGPGQAYYPCAVLSNSATVQVVGEQTGWAKIVPPQGCFSLVSKKYVKAEGQAGTVTATNVVVRAGSDLTPNRMDVQQTKLNVGDKVSILGELGDFYKITPPPGVYLYISAEFVKPAGSDVTLAAASTTGPVLAPSGATKLSDVAEAVPAAGRRTTTRPSVAAALAPSAATISQEKTAWEAAEKMLNDEYKKPRDQRNLKGLLDQYKSIHLAAKSPFEPYVQARVKFLSDELELTKDLQSVETTISDVESERAKMAAERAQIKADTPNIPTRKSFAVEGILQPSGLYAGGATGPKRFTIGVKPLISAYVQCTSGVVELDKYVGQYVGVMGTPRYDEKSGMYVVEAEQVVVLKPGVLPGSSVASPAVKPSSAPAEAVPPAVEAPAAVDAPAPEKPAAEVAEKPVVKAPDPAAVKAPGPAAPTAPASKAVNKPATAASAPAAVLLAPPTSKPVAPVNPEEYE